MPDIADLIQKDRALGTVNTYGSWVQLVASTSEDILLWWITLTVPQWGGQDWSVLIIGTGAAASEVEVLSLPFRNEASHITQVQVALPVPILIPSGTRIAARVALNSTFGAGYLALGHIKVSVVSSF